MDRMGGEDSENVCTQKEMKMGKKSSAKVHTYIGHPRSLCGLTDRTGSHKILNFQSFFTATDEEQCQVCLNRLSARGYSISKLRRDYRSVADKARQLPLAA